MIDCIWEFDEMESTNDHQSHATDLIGDPMQEDISEDVTRIYVQNLNGLGWNKEGGKWQYVCDVLETIQADIACFSELNTNTNKYEVRHKMESICQQHFPQNRLVLASSKHNTTTTYKPGGTAILARNNITACITSHTRDRMGRWVSIRVTSASSRKIRIISAYQVCQSTSTGTNTAAAHQRAQLIEEAALLPHHSRSTPRQAFIQELQSFIQQCLNEQEEIILAGDFNDDITQPDSGMEKIATSCGLVDLYGLRLGTSDQPATYQRGSRRLDYILLSPSILPHVKAAGYDPFGYRIPSDHRGMFVDLDTETLLQQDLYPLATPEHREFKTTSPGVVQKYVTAKMKYLNDHRFFDRLTTMENLTQPAHALAEALDRDFQRASIHAARMCTKKPKPPWSPKLAQAWAEIHYYKLAKSSLDTTVNLSDAILRLQQKWPNLPTPAPTDRHVIHHGIRQAYLALKQARQSAQTLREEFLINQCAQYTAMEDKHKAKIMRKLLRAESQHKVYQKIQQLRNQEGGSFSLSSIRIPRNIPISDIEATKKLPDTPEHWETVTVPEEIERILLQRNQHHFGQAEGTPFTIPPLQADVGYQAEGYAADLILAGHASYESTSRATSLFIKHLRARTIEVLEGRVTMEEIRNKLRRWKESTTTSPSGLHLGHYHCTWRDPRVTGEDAEITNKIRGGQEQLLRATTSFLNYAIKFGYTFYRWTKVVNIMLQKDPGNPRIHRLRIIHIYEADYNMLLAIKWRQALHFAEDRKLLNDGMYGSRPGRTAHEPALIEVLQHETYRMSMKSGINFDLDATSCYDRILASVAALCSRRIGMPAEVVKVNTANLQQAHYHLKTKLGMSEGSYSHSLDNPIHGTGQGSGNSPSIWCFVCSALFDALESITHGATFTTYDQSITIPMYMIGFVDDCTQRINCFDADIQPTAAQLITLMEKDVQSWNDLLWVSGGALEQSKCSYHIVQSEWTPDGHPFLRGGTENIPIRLHHGGIVTTTLQKSNYTAHKTLGCHINPAFSNIQPWITTSKKNENFAQLLETNYFTRSESWTFYTAIYLPSLTYPLPITPLSKQQCSHLDSRFLRTLIPRCGYNRNMSRAIRYAPFYMGGAGFKPLYVVQGSLMLQHLYKHLNSPDTTVGKMLLITISWTQAFLGVSFSFLQDVHSKIPPAGPSWLLEVRTFLNEINGSLPFKTAPVPPLLRVHDRFIMDIVMLQEAWTKQQIIQINSCRRYLQAQTLADITNIQGTRISQRIRSCFGSPTSKNVRQSLFNQSRPNPKAWRTWNKFLDTLSNKYGVWHQPLGNWTKTVQHTRHWPTTVYNPESDELYTHHTGSMYLVHERLFPGIFTIRPTDQRVEASGYPSSTIIIMDTLRPVSDYDPMTNSRDDYTINLQVVPSIQVDAWEYDLLRFCRNTAEEKVLAASIRAGSILTCSDGSATNEGGSFGFVVSTLTGLRIAKGRGLAPGSSLNSFRSEAYGVLATLRWLHRIMQGIPPNERHTLTHYLDNRSVISRIEATMSPAGKFPNHRLLSNQDVIDEIVATIDKLPVHIDIQWVKGHQDASSSFHLLQLPAQLNCEADREAANYISSQDERQRNIPPLPHTPCQLCMQGRTVTSHIKRRAQDAYSLPSLSQYVKQKFNWDDSTYMQIDWPMYSQIISKYKDTWSTVVKHLHDISPTGSIAHRNNRHLPHECPACMAPNEDNPHLITCNHPSRSAWRTTTISKLTQYEATQVDPILLDILQDGLTRLHRQLAPMNTNHYPTRYSTLIRNQNTIGWIHLYRARWSREWGSLQDDYITRCPQATSNLSGAAWVLGAGRLLIDQWLQLWKLRNNERHGRDLITHNRIREQVVTSELHELYSYRDRVCPSDRSLFHPSVSIHLQRHPKMETIEDWILQNKPAILASAEQAKRLGIHRNHSLYEYPIRHPIAQASERAGLTAGPPTG